mgnify:FL=1|jgi:hypothetical protein|tara:strand:- start:2325 stop:2774 length:450 start_codon:yes stop_codon:yes gene_type:complete
MEREIVVYSLVFLFVAIFIFGPIRTKAIEGFSHYNLQTPGILPESETLPIMSNMYPYSGKKHVGNETSSTLWKDYPITEMSSYKQITNNFRYNKSPDEGTCTPADMCNVLYDDIKTPSNIVSALPPADEANINQTRVNYYVSNSPSLDM